MNRFLLFMARLTSEEMFAALFEQFCALFIRRELLVDLRVARLFLSIFLLSVFQGCAPLSQFARLYFESMNLILLLLNLFLVLFAHIQQVIVGDPVILDLQQFIEGFLAVAWGLQENSREGSLWYAQGIAEKVFQWALAINTEEFVQLIQHI